MVTRTRRQDNGGARRARGRRQGEDDAANGAGDEDPDLQELQDMVAGANAGAARQLAVRAGQMLVDNAGPIVAVAAVGTAAAVLEAELLPGVLIGAGAVVVGIMFPRVGMAMRPVAKRVIRAGLEMGDRARDLVAEAGEQVQDLVAEAQSDRAQAAEARPRRRRMSAAAAVGEASPA